MNDFSCLAERLRAEPAVLVGVERVDGSGPREVGAWMAVFATGQVGTIGGGQLEWQMLAHGRAVLAGQIPLQAQHRCALGPSLGQCCGGVVHLVCQAVSVQDVPRLQSQLRQGHWPVALFGGGHVGQALVQALLPLPFSITWVDSRDGIFPAWSSSEGFAQVQCEHSDPVQRAVHDLVPGSAVLIMSFSHAEDLDVVAECLLRQRTQGDLRWVGLIGSQTKWASFRHRLEARGFLAAELDAITCPIGLPGIAGKQPAVIAASVVAQLLQVFAL